MSKIEQIWSDKASCYVIAEVGMAHDGSLGLAHAYIDAIARTGADAVKFQTHIPNAESTPGEPFRLKGAFPQDQSRFDYWQRTSFTDSEWAQLMTHAQDRDLDFLSSPFSLEAIEMLDRARVVPAWKIASGEVNNGPLLRAAASTGRPVLLSSGMSDFGELDSAIRLLEDAKNQYAIFQCTTAYPCPPEQIGLNVMLEFKDRYQCPVGLSDHSGTIYPCLTSVALGARMIEIHVVLSHDSFGPDVKASVTVDQMCQLVEGVRFNEAMFSNPVDKQALAQEMAPLRAIFNKSIVAARDLAENTVLSEQDLAFRKPGTGLATSQLPNVLGKRLKRALQENEQLAATDVC